MSDIENEKSRSSKDKDFLHELWKKEIENALNYQKEWKDEATKYEHCYTSVDGSSDYCHNSKMYNIFYANTQTLAPLVFSKMPNPNITRRFFDEDKISKIGSEMMERIVNYYFDIGNVYTDFAKIRTDYLITGRGVARVYYDAGEIVETEQQQEELVDGTKKVGIRYIHWEDFLTSTEKDWQNIRWVAFKQYRTRQAIIDEFGNKTADNVLYETPLKEEYNQGLQEDLVYKVAAIWEIWDKATNRVVWYSEQCILGVEEPPFSLKGFFPIARPLGTESNPQSILPIPLFRMYYRQALELNRIEEQIADLTKQITFNGAYSSSAEVQDIQNFLNGENGEFHPLATINSGDISKAIFVKPIQDIANVVMSLQQRKKLLINDIREITGISDILRGVTVAQETATAQRLKGNFAISRIQPIQRAFETFLRDTMELLIELVVENFDIIELAKITNLQVIDVEAIQKMTEENLNALLQEGVSNLPQNITPEQRQQQIEQLKQQAQAGFQETMKIPLEKLKGYAITPQELEELKMLFADDKMRDYSINIETDSTVELDQNQLKQDRMEFLQIFTNTLSQILPAIQSGVVSEEAGREILGFALRPFKAGRTIEEHLFTKEEKKNEPSIQEQLLLKESQRKDMELQLKQQGQQNDFAIKREQTNIEKAKVQLEMAKIEEKAMQFKEKIDFEDANKAADRNLELTTKLSAPLVQQATQDATNTIREFKA